MWKNRIQKVILIGSWSDIFASSGCWVAGVEIAGWTSLFCCSTCFPLKLSQFRFRAIATTFWAAGLPVLCEAFFSTPPVITPVLQVLGVWCGQSSLVFLTSATCGLFTYATMIDRGSWLRNPSSRTIRSVDYGTCSQSLATWRSCSLLAFIGFVKETFHASADSNTSARLQRGISPESLSQCLCEILSSLHLSQDA